VATPHCDEIQRKKLARVVPTMTVSSWSTSLILVAIPNSCVCVALPVDISFRRMAEYACVSRARGMERILKISCFYMCSTRNSSFENELAEAYGDGETFSSRR
jgi:hypothetical protein